MKKIAILSMIALSTIAGVAQAKDVKYHVGVAGHQETYKEKDDDGSMFMQEKAKDMMGIVGGAVVTLDSGTQLDIEGQYLRGKSTYTGAFQGQPYGSLVMDGVKRSMWQLEGVAKFPTVVGGYDMRVGGGLGIRKLTDNLQDFVGGYKRTNELVYLKAGVEKDFAIGDGWTSTPKVYAKYVVKGTQKSVSDTFDLTHDQPGGYGFDVSVKFEKEIQGKNTYFEPYYRTWEIRKSDVTMYNGGETVEPKNNTSEFGVKVGMTF